MVLDMHTTDENSPTLSGKADESDEGKGSLGEKLVEHVYEACNPENNVQFNGDTFDRCGTWAAGHNDQTSVVGEDSHGGYPLSTSYNQVLWLVLSNKWSLWCIWWISCMPNSFFWDAIQFFNILL